MEWQKLDNELDEHTLEIVNWIEVKVGKYYDNSNTYQVGLESTFAELYDCEKRFRSLDKCKKYVEKGLVKFAKQLNKKIANAQST